MHDFKSMWLARRARPVLMALAFALSHPGVAQAQTWGKPSRQEARYGLRTIVCHTGVHGHPCLGLACRGGKLLFVSTAGGGGPLEGRARVATGDTAFDVHFHFDAKAIDVLGVAAASAELTDSQVEALLIARTLTIVPRAASGIRHQFPTDRLNEQGRIVSQSCHD